MVYPPSPHKQTLDLEALESDPLPTFIVKVSDRASFDIVYCNEALRRDPLRDVITASTREAIIFRSWTTAVRFYNQHHEFSNRKWTATVAGKKEGWKIIQAVEILIPKQTATHSRENSIPQSHQEQEDFCQISKDESMQRTYNRPRVPLGDLPSQNIHARWNSLQTMMEMSDVGVFEYLPTGKLIHANDAWYRLSNHPRNLSEHVEFSFMDLAYPDDQEIIMSAWNSLIQGSCITFEMRWKPKPGSGQQAQWVLSACVPVFDEDHNLISIAGNTIDINDQKRLQQMQRLQIDEALEAKRQQENFIDMTSHELRNPLSAVIQCADSVISALHRLEPKEVISTDPQVQKVSDEISICIDSLHTIVSCSLHQKRIIDDVLTLSKLDSNLLLISPVRVEPVLVVSEAIKMFDVECSQMHINLQFKEDDSLKGFEWVMIDPSRMLQVLINLLTNAIKFTKDSDIRNITVTLGGAWTHRSLEEKGVTFAKDNQPQSSIHDQLDWGSGVRGYIWLRVDDTGCGMTDYEQTRLFSRFTQATPRTHIKYGGSGLGLFISKSLAALQGGSIGVTSTANAGSSFMFYISTRTAEPPKDAAISRAMRPKVQRTVSREVVVKAARLNILMVEDNLVNQKVLSKQLQKAGCNVSVAGNGVEALEWLKSSVYWRGELVQSSNNAAGPISPSEVDIVLMDIEMPVMDGLTCAREIRAWESRRLLAPPSLQSLSRQQSSSDADALRPSFQDLNVSEKFEQQWTNRLPILAVSANARSEQVQEALAAGMDDAISKPFRISELLPKMCGLVPRCANLSS